MKNRWVIGHLKKAPFREWGVSRITALNAKDPSSKMMSIAQVSMPFGDRLPTIRHKKTHEWFMVLEGEVNAELDGKKVLLKSGDSVYMPPMVWHSFQARGRKTVQVISIYFPALDQRKLDFEVKPK